VYITVYIDVIGTDQVFVCRYTQEDLIAFTGLWAPIIFTTNKLFTCNLSEIVLGVFEFCLINCMTFAFLNIQNLLAVS